MKIVEARYLPEIGASIVTIRKGEELFEGVSFLHQEDKDIESSYAGCQFAETKAYIKMVKWEYKEAKKELTTLKRLYQQITQLKEFQEEKYGRTCQHIRKQIKIQERKVDGLKSYYEYLEANYPEVVQKRLDRARDIPNVLAQMQAKREREKEELE